MAEHPIPASGIYETVFAKSKAHGGAVVSVNRHEAESDDNYTIVKPPEKAVKELAIQETEEESVQTIEERESGLQPSGEAADEVDEVLGNPAESHDDKAEDKSPEEHAPKPKGKKKINKK